jgi:hypothetical protein
MLGRLRRLRAVAAVSVAAGLSALAFFDQAFAAWRWPLIAAAAASFLAIMVVFARRQEVLAFAALVREQSARWGPAFAEWVKRAGPHDFDVRISGLQDLSKEHGTLAELPVHVLEELQRHRFLEQFGLADTAGLSRERKQILISSGMETAADLTPDRVSHIEGLGRRGRVRVAAWRRRLENKFVFDGQRQIDKQDLAAVEKEVLREQWRIETAMVRGVADLKAIKARIARERVKMIDDIRRTKRDYLQAVANHRAARGRFI